MMNIDDLHEQIMLFEELEDVFFRVHAKPEDETRRKKLLQQIVQLKEKARAEFNALDEGGLIAVTRAEGLYLSRAVAKTEGEETRRRKREIHPAWIWKRPQVDRAVFLKIP